MKLGQESVQLITVFDWVRWNKLDSFIWHIANERRTTPQAGSLLKRMGVKAGVADIAVMKAAKGFHGMFIELKTVTGVLSPKQKEFLHSMNENGYLAKVAYSADEAIKTIQEYLGIAS